MAQESCVVKGGGFSNADRGMPLGTWGCSRTALARIASAMGIMTNGVKEEAKCQMRV